MNYDKSANPSEKVFRSKLIETIIMFTGNLESVNWDYISTRDMEFFVRAFYQGVR